VAAKRKYFICGIYNWKMVVKNIEKKSSGIMNLVESFFINVYMVTCGITYSPHDYLMFAYMEKDDSGSTVFLSLFDICAKYVNIWLSLFEQLGFGSKILGCFVSLLWPLLTFLVSLGFLFNFWILTIPQVILIPFTLGGSILTLILSYILWGVILAFFVALFCSVWFTLFFAFMGIGFKYEVCTGECDDESALSESCSDDDSVDDAQYESLHEGSMPADGSYHEKTFHEGTFGGYFDESNTHDGTKNTDYSIYYDNASEDNRNKRKKHRRHHKKSTDLISVSRDDHKHSNGKRISRQNSTELNEEKKNKHEECDNTSGILSKLKSKFNDKKSESKDNSPKNNGIKSSMDSSLKDDSSCSYILNDGHKSQDTRSYDYKDLKHYLKSQN
jgi:hypothetical protein